MDKDEDEDVASLRERSQNQLTRVWRTGTPVYEMVYLLHRRLLLLEQAMLSTAGPPTTESPTKASPSGVLAPASIAPPAPASSLQPGEQMVADLFHAAHCSECAAALGVLLAQCRTHAQGAAR